MSALGLQNPEWQVSGKSFPVIARASRLEIFEFYFYQITCRDQLFIFFIFPIQAGIYFERMFFPAPPENFLQFQRDNGIREKLRVDSNTV